jgi:L-alanine-DL-glutamate epimerase-like enolase superfamily enzyme
LQVSVTLANFMTLEIYTYFSDAKNYVQVLENAPEAQIKGGWLEVEDKPSLGVTLARENVKSLPPVRS